MSEILKLEVYIGVPGWLSGLSVRFLILAQVMITVCGFEPCAEHLQLQFRAYFGFFLSFSLSAPSQLTYMLSLSLSLINKLKEKEKYKI